MACFDITVGRLEYFDPTGWKKEEPYDEQLPLEKPRLLRRSFQMLLDEGIKTRDQIVYDLRLTTSDMEEMADLQIGFFSGLDFASPKVRDSITNKAGNGGVIQFPRWTSEVEEG